MSLLTTEPRKEHLFDQIALTNYLKKNIPQFGNNLIKLLQFKAGQSNPTFYLKDNLNNEFVLRKKPPGTLLPSAVCLKKIK